METASTGVAKAKPMCVPPQMPCFQVAARAKAKLPTQTSSKNIEAKVRATNAKSKHAPPYMPPKLPFSTAALKAKQPMLHVPSPPKAAGIQEGRKRQGFSLAPVPQKKTRPTVNCSIAGIQKSTKPVVPPTCVAARLKDRPLVMGFKIETHDWEERTGNKGSIGKFGFYNICHPDDFKQRIVQLGWSIWTRESGGMETKERLIRPDEFVISAKAETYHGISQWRAEAGGMPIGTVLEEFLTDTRSIYDGGGTLVCHQMEFNANIIEHELIRSGLNDRLDEFARIIKAGCCTMSPQIGRWLKESFGEDAGTETTQNTMKLQDMIAWLFPGETELLKKRHTAGAAANRHARLFLKLSSLATASAA